MSVLIKMEMPNTCKECIIGNPKNKTCYILGLPKINLEVREDCPLIEVQTPHGRLIDADALIEELKECMDAANDNWEYEMVTGYSNAIESVEEADTIIESEGSEK